jgi:hypothetical protein
MDVKNILEVLAAIELLGVSGKEIAKDGLGIDDLPKALELVKKYQVILDAVNDVKLVVDEAKDIDSAEAVLVVTKLMSVVKNIKEA